MGLGLTLIYFNTTYRRDRLVELVVSDVIEERRGNAGVTVVDNGPVSGSSSDELPKLSPVVEVLNGLQIPWDLEFIELAGKSGFLFTERSGTLKFVEYDVTKGGSVTKNEVVTVLSPPDISVGGEGGLMGLAVDSNFTENGYIYMCFNSSKPGDGKKDVRVGRWRLGDDLKADNRTDIVTGMPSINSQRHSGCQLEFGPDDNLWIGTGDAATGSFPQDPNSLGGKILRVNRNGDGVDGNMDAPYDARIFSYGHRNVQGLDFFPVNNQPSIKGAQVLGLSMEHGPSIDDELNFLLTGNAGWDPVPGYNESVPMTDKVKYPDAFTALWSSGRPTIGASDIEILSHAGWKKWEGAVMVAALAAENVKVLDFAGDYANTSEPMITTILADHGRIRSITMAENGSLLILTANGSNSDKILLVKPH